MPGYRIVPLESVTPLFLLMRRRMLEAGWTPERYRSKWDEIAASHSAKMKPHGASALKPTPNGYLRYGINIGGHKVTYQVRPPDYLAIEAIRLSM